MAKKVTTSPQNKISISKNSAETAIQSFDLEPFMVSDKILWLLFGLLVVAYFSFSFVSTGFYQQDEAAHFVSMLEFWNNPNTILGNWAKPGYKLIYAVPALFGKEFVAFINCLFAAGACLMSYKVAQKMGSKLPLLAFILLATQPLWAVLAFRNYSEIVAAFLLIAALYFYIHEKFIFSALFASYICFIRQEFYPFAGLFFLVLVYQKKYLPAVLLSVFPLIQNIWGMTVTGDWLYLLNQILGASEKIGDAYPRKGFEHYFRFAAVIYGAVGMTLTVAYLAAKVTQRQRPNYLLVVPMVLYFLMYCIFNIKAVSIGPASAGNLRYLVFISPLVAVCGAFAVEEFRKTSNKLPILLVLGVLTILAAVYMTYNHNFIKFDENVRNWTTLVGVFATVLLLIVPLTSQQYTYSFLAITVFLGLITIRPIKISAEDEACRLLAYWYYDFEKKNGEPPQVIYQHDMISYYLNRPKGSFKNPVKNLDSLNVVNAPKGSLIIWDSHYSYRPELRKGSLKHFYFIDNPEYEMLDEVMSFDQTFGALIFRKK